MATKKDEAQPQEGVQSAEVKTDAPVEGKDPNAAAERNAPGQPEVDNADKQGSVVTTGYRDASDEEKPDPSTIAQVEEVESR